MTFIPLSVSLGIGESSGRANWLSTLTAVNTHTTDMTPKILLGNFKMITKALVRVIEFRD